MALHPRDEMDRLYVSREEERRGLANIEDSVDASVWGREDYIKKTKERLITVPSNSIDSIRINRTTITKKQKWEEKQLYRYFKRQTNEISLKMPGTWPRKGNFKRNRISSNSSTKQHQKDQLRYSKNW